MSPVPIHDPPVDFCISAESRIQSSRHLTNELTYPVPILPSSVYSPISTPSSRHHQKRVQEQNKQTLEQNMQVSTGEDK